MSKTPDRWPALVVCQGGSTAHEHVVIKPGEIVCTSFGEQTTNVTVVRRADGRQTVVCRFNPSGQ